MAKGGDFNEEEEKEKAEAEKPGLTLTDVLKVGWGEGLVRVSP